MANVIGPKGQLVIEKGIRDQLGVGPGWKAIQRVVDDHVELRFIPPTHNRSLAGILKHLVPVGGREPTDEELDQAIEAGFAEAAREEEERIQADWKSERQSDNRP
jgi:bifunctional DNA-binding transcriptional regulator/antitoxin component of YhaV-PrlF toxin-antitoxin module